MTSISEKLGYIPKDNDIVYFLASFAKNDHNGSAKSIHSDPHKEIGVQKLIGRLFESVIIEKNMLSGSDFASVNELISILPRYDVETARVLFRGLVATAFSAENFEAKDSKKVLGFIKSALNYIEELSPEKYVMVAEKKYVDTLEKLKTPLDCASRSVRDAFIFARSAAFNIINQNDPSNIYTHSPTGVHQPPRIVMLENGTRMYV